MEAVNVNEARREAELELRRSGNASELELRRSGNAAGRKRIEEIGEFYRTFDPKGLGHDLRHVSMKVDNDINEELQTLRHEYNEKLKSEGKPEESIQEAWPDWEDTYGDSDFEALFPPVVPESFNTGGRPISVPNLHADLNSLNDPCVGIPGQGGIKWSKGNKLLDDAYPEYAPPEPYGFDKELAEWSPETSQKGDGFKNTTEEIKPAIPEAERSLFALRLSAMKDQKNRAYYEHQFNERFPKYVAKNKHQAAGKFSFSSQRCWYNFTVN